VSEVQYDVIIGMFRVRCHSAGNVVEGRWSAENRSGREDRTRDLGYEGSRGVGSVAEVKWSGGSIAEVKQSSEDLIKVQKAKGSVGGRKKPKLERAKSEASVL